MKAKPLHILLLAAFCGVASLDAQPLGDSERGQGQRPAPSEIFDKLDTDQSGRISAEEAKGPMAKHFDRIDKDGDGMVSQAEMQEAGQKMRKKKKGQLGQKLKEMDTDGNGSISKDEASQRLAGQFDEIDFDGDGELTREELKAAAKSNRSSGPDSGGIEGKKLK